MKVHELRDLLNSFDGDLELYLQIDPEGNCYRSVAGAEICVAIEDGYDVEVHHPEYDAEEAGFDDDEDSIRKWDELRENPNGVVIWPE